MDPNKTLEELRELVHWALTADREDEGPYASSIAEKFDSLDQWLTRGGFPPRQWAGALPKGWNRG